MNYITSRPVRNNAQGMMMVVSNEILIEVVVAGDMVIGIVMVEMVMEVVVGVVVRV